jgi:hypothetical protein
LVVFVVELVAFVVGELPPVDTLGDVEHAAPSKARATTHAASPARRRGIRREGEGEGEGFVVFRMKFIMTLSTEPRPGSVHSVQLRVAFPRVPP